MDLRTRRRALMAMQESGPRETLFTSPLYYKLNSSALSVNYVAQGACAVHKGDDYLIYFITTASNTTQYLYSYNLNSGAVTSLATYTDLWHANSLTYNPTLNVLYVGTENSSKGIGVIDLSDFSLVSTNPVYDAGGDVQTPYAIAYDRTNDCIYSCVGWTKVLVYDTSFNLLRTIDLVNPITDHTTGQGLETDGTYLYRLFSAPANKVDVYTVGGDFVCQMDLSGITYEAEEFCYDWEGRFYLSCYGNASGRAWMYAVAPRTFDGYLNLSYVPSVAYALKQTTGTAFKWGTVSFTFNSTGAAGWNLNAQSGGSPYGYSYLNGKKCRISYSIKRASGSTGRVVHQLFTSDSNANTASSTNFATATKANYIPASTTEYTDFVHEFTLGEDFLVPESGQEGTYVNWRIYLNADSGNKCYVKNFKFEVEV